MMTKENFYIITGGPGSGKTTLLNELQLRGYNCVPEVGRQIIRQQLEMGGDALPWKDYIRYSQLMLEHSMKDYENLQNSSIIYFFDRGIPDTYGYERLMGMSDNLLLNHAIAEYRYNPKVFILPPWREIYENDKERKQDFLEAIDTYEKMITVYKELNYQLLEIPKVSVKERADYLLTFCK